MTLFRIPDIKRRHTVLVTGLLFAVLARSAAAAIDASTPRVNAQVDYLAGAGSSQLSYQAHVTDPATNPIPPPAAADAALTVPDFSPPRGAPGDTAWQPAELRAYQTAVGFNTTSVAAAIADGLAYHRLAATTTWSISAQIIGPMAASGSVHLTLDYLLFPGEVGLTPFGGYTGEAGIRALIRQTGTQFPASVSSELVMNMTPGSLIPTLSFDGDFGATPPVVSAELRDGLIYNVAHTEPLVGSVDLGKIEPGEIVNVEYIMESWLEFPGYEVAGFARVGDPFGLAGDPEAYLGSQFPGLGSFTFALRETPAPVPLPGALALFASAAATLARGRRRRR